MYTESSSAESEQHTAFERQVLGWGWSPLIKRLKLNFKVVPRKAPLLIQGRFLI